MWHDHHLRYNQQVPDEYMMDNLTHLRYNQQVPDEYMMDNLTHLRYNQQVPDDVVWALDTHNDRAQDSCNTEALTLTLTLYPPRLYPLRWRRCPNNPTKPSPM